MSEFKWQLIFLAFVFFYQNNTEVQSAPIQRIVNGFQAIPKQFPYQVLLNRQTDTEWEPFCGGAIISKRIILTAAHCIEDNLNEIKIYFGAVERSNIKEPGQQHLLVQRNNIVVHPEWERRQKINDIALIKLPADLQFDEYIQPANLPDPNQSYENQTGVVSGWGDTSDQDPPSEQLLYFDTPILSNEDCKPIVHKYHPNIFFPSSWICIEPSKSCTCGGDSGGPLVIWSEVANSTLVGLTSFAMAGECTVNSPDVFTRVSSFLPWIKKYK
ncbi:brachyurin-like [Drosophila innubila]|uniref:brachyurin-like n=1 Tax=Drosophila innubila TaxID=198719 RepID=UPI00148C51AB|nr:brachyurin-like [Drosophila innubila]